VVQQKWFSGFAVRNTVNQKIAPVAADLRLTEAATGYRNLQRAQKELTTWKS
jgi:hypothetical protein